MATYAYAVNKRDKFHDVVSLIGIAAYFSLVFIIPSIEKAQLNPLISKNLYAIMAILFIIMAVMPMYKMSKRKKNSSILIETTRKGILLTVLDKKETVAWKELERSVIIYDMVSSKIIPRKFILRYGNNSVSLDNDPYGAKLENAVELAQLLSDNIPNLNQEIIGLKGVCPWCGPYKTDKKCPECKGKIKYVPRIQKIFYTIRIDIILVALVAMLMGNLMFFIGSALIILLVMLPLSMAIRSDYAVKNSG
jgi:hypothetical protein